MATLVRWDPLREVAVMQNELSYAWETKSELVYAFDLRGVAQDKISVEVEDGTLTVSAERERSEEISEELFHRFERRHGSFSRTVGLPQGATEESIKATYKDGVLEIHLPKPEQPKPKKIEIGFETPEASTIEGHLDPVVGTHPTISIPRGAASWPPRSSCTRIASASGRGLRERARRRRSSRARPR
jgi:HSP20 family protein